MSDFIRTLVVEWGPAGVAFLMFLENVFPPIPSELILPLAGYAAGRGAGSLPLLILGGVFGSVVGTCLWFVAGLWLGKAGLKAFASRRGRWLTLAPRDVDAADAWFDRHGGKTVLLGRLLPAVRTLISVPAAVSGMSWPRFLLYTSIGTTIWSTALACAGFWLGNNYGLVAEWLAPVSTGIVVLLVAGYLYRVVTFEP
ncbi:membrane protein DedA with SNARE-associated domain [Amorphus suaedae]